MRLQNEALAHGVQLELKDYRLGPPQELEGLTDQQKVLHDKALEAAKRRVMERARRDNNAG